MNALRNFVPFLLVSSLPMWAVAQGPPFPPANPASQNVSQRAIDRLNDLIEGFVNAEEIVGAEILVIKNRRTIMHETFGRDNPNNEAKLASGSIYSIRSMTKPLAGATAQMLIDEGHLSLNDPVEKYLPSFQNRASKEVTIEHLLTHRSGIPMKSAGRLWSDYSAYKSVQEVAEYWGEYGPRLFQPGQKYHYADGNVDTLGAIIEKVSGEPAEVTIQKRLIQPLGMNDTMSLLQKGDPRIKKVVGKNAGGRGRWKQFWRWRGQPYFSFPMFAQGFYSTPTDYARFLAMVMDGGVSKGKRILSESAVERMLTPSSRTTMPTGFANLNSSYGQLMHLYDKHGDLVAFGHSGSDGTYAWAWPEQDLMVLYFTQSRGNTTMNRIEAVIDSLLARPVLGVPKE